ncbi:MAG TPA: YCF48-related protein [Candidatus Binatia bacterium]|nr:YCF48-related protein [Candidatus Binatia bacterium]
MPAPSKWLLALPILALAACHRDVEKTPLIDRRVYITDRFYDVQAVTPEHVVIVGYGGKILDTHDGGRTWENRPSGTDNALYKVDLLDEKTGWAVGQGGTIIKTTDGGATWNKQESGTENYLFSFHALTPEHVIAVGDRSEIVESKDGGATWKATEYKPPKEGAGGMTAEEETVAQAPSFYDVTFIDGKTGWIVGEFGKILKTTDGGATWKEQQQTLIGGEIVDALSLPTFFGVHFVDANNGAAAGLDGRIAITADGGATWTFDDVGAALSVPLFEVQLFPDGSGWAVGSAGQVLRKNGLGETWQPADLGMRVFSWLRDVSFADPKNGWLVGGFGLILRTRDGGKTWVPIAA